MINQINIVVDEKTDILNGYSNVAINDLEKITNGYVNNIVFTNIDKVPQQFRNPIFVSIVKKLSHGGKLTIKYINPHMIANRIKNNAMNGEQFASVTSNIRSCWSEPDFLSLMSGLEDCTMSKHYYDDIFCISVIEKKK